MGTSWFFHCGKEGCCHAIIRTAKGPIRTVKILSCGFARQRSATFPTEQHLCRARRECCTTTTLTCVLIFVVLANATMRQDSLSCVVTLPCVESFAVRQASAVQLTLRLCRAHTRCHAPGQCRATVLCRAPTPNAHGKAYSRHTQPHARSTLARHVVPLPCVYTRQSDQMSFVVCIHTAKAPAFYSFLMFFI
jgi:hypothetical protein